MAIYKTMTEKYNNKTNRYFIDACDRLAREFCKTLDVSVHPEDSWWVSYGSVFAFQCGEMFTNAEEMMLAIEHKMTYEEWAEWYWEWIRSDDNGNPLPGRINLNSWLRGARYNDDKEKEQ